MAGNTALYTPNPLIGTDPQSIALWAQNEFQVLSRTLSSIAQLQMSVLSTAPVTPRQGLMAYADGVHWNPGSGQGLYEYNGTSWVFAGVTAGQVPGTGTNDNAAAGNVGEYIQGVVASGSPVSLVSGTAKNLTSISLSAGDWDVAASISIMPASTTSITAIVASVSAGSGAVDTSNGRYGQMIFGGGIVTGGSTLTVPVVPVRWSLAGTTVLYAVGEAVFTVSTCNMFGLLRARRVR